MTENDLSARFPELQPIHSVPNLWHFNGCGFLLLGRRDFDLQTESYIQTRCLCIFGVPILALGAYRVMDSPDGKYIMGREPLSSLARTFNVLVLLAALGVAGHYGWREYSSSPAYIARQKLSTAERLATAGKLAESARLCRDVALGPGPAGSAQAAVQLVTTLLAHPAARESSAELAGVFEVAVALQRAGRWPQPAEVLYNQGMALESQRGSTDPGGALAILEAIAPLAPRREDLNTARRRLLEALVVAHPGDPELASRLAVVYETQGQDERAIALLEPLRARLGTTEGARVLGLADARRDHFDRALALLRPYTQARLKSFHAAESALSATIEAAQKAILERLKAERPSDFDVQRYARSDKADQRAQLEEYVAGKLKGDPAIDQVQERLLRESSVVPVALELGMILLQHAQGQADPKARKSELDEAERIFLAVGSMARESDAYRLNLAQVYYWQGKHGQGKALLDEVLVARKRDPKLLVEVSELLRRTGSQTDARAMAEEAYNTASDSALKQYAAVQRGLLGVDADERILWLRRGNSNEPRTKALLSFDLARQALECGEEAAAIAHLREAIGLYESLPESPSTLNNAALALFRLGTLTGDQGAMDRGLAKIEKAYKLEPSDSLTMTNAGNFLLEEALRDVIGRSIDLSLLRDDADLEMLSFLYSDQAGRTKYVERVKSHPGINRAIALLDKALLLAPRRDDVYKILGELSEYRGEGDRQRALLRRLEQVDLDQADELALAKEYYAGRRDDELRKQTAAAIAHAESALKAARAGKRDQTFAAAAVVLVGRRIRGHHFGLAADPDAIVALAEDAYAAAPSHRARHALVAGLLFRAGGRLARNQPAYAKMQAKSARSTDDPLLIGVALGGENPLRDAARQDPDVRRAIGLVREAYHADPQYEAGPWPWSLLRALHPEEAAAMSATYLKNESSRISRAIKRRVEPVSASVALASYWIAEMEGKLAEGRAALKEYAARGVPLPIESP